MLLIVKTTIDVPDALLAEARELARRERTTVRALVADGLRRVLDERAIERDEPPPEPVFRGRLGVRPGVDLGDWDALREVTYGRWA